jgi:hypothetical protein
VAEPSSESPSASVVRLGELAALLLERYGLACEFDDHDPNVALLRVIRPGAGVVALVSTRSGRVYAFHDLHIGLADDLPKVAARLAWLLGVLDDARREAPPTDPDT